MTDPQPPHDPRLEIPEVLQKPVHVPGVTDVKPKQPLLGKVAGGFGNEMALGVDFLATSAAAAGLGWLIDWWLGSSPAGLVVGVVVGFTFATVRLVRRTSPAASARSKDAQDRQRQQKP